MSQKLLIPNIGTILLLAEDWSFRLYFERRNDIFFAKGFGLKKGKYYRHYGEIDLTEDDFEGEMPEIQYEKAMTKEELEQSYKSYAATNSHDNPYVNVTLPKGTQLKVDRIYIRTGGEAFASITFRTTKVCPEKRFASKRFWVKLKDANKIICDVVG